MIKLVISEYRLARLGGFLGRLNKIWYWYTKGTGMKEVGIEKIDSIRI